MKHYCTKLFIRAMVLLKAIQTGMHIAFLVGMIQLLFGQRPVSSVAGILLVWFFVFMTGASPSAVRAGIMQTILLTAPLVRRENDGPTSLAAALAFILLINPFGCGSVSLQLSFAAMAGMVLLAEPITALLLRAFGCDPQSRLRPAFSVIGGSLAVLICSTPFSVLRFDSDCRADGCKSTLPQRRGDHCGSGCRAG